MQKTLAAAALLLAFSASAPAAAQEVALRAHHFAAADAAAHALLVAPWARRLEAQSGGRLRVRVFPAMALGGRPAQLAGQVRAGEVDIVYTRPAFTAGRFPRTAIFELPFLHADAMASTLALQDYYEAHLREEYAEYRVLLLHAHDGDALHVARPVRSLEDFKGLKIRTATRGAGVLLRALGATPVGTPAQDLPQMLAKGLLDGCLLPYGDAAALGAAARLRHHVTLEGPRPRFGTAVHAFLMSRDAYEALAPELRELVDAHSGRHLAWYAGKSWREAEAPGIAAARAAGGEFAALPAAEAARIRAAVEPEIARALAALSRRGGFDAAALYRDAQSLVQKYLE